MPPLLNVLAARLARPWSPFRGDEIGLRVAAARTAPAAELRPDAPPPRDAGGHRRPAYAPLLILDAIRHAIGSPAPAASSPPGLAPAAEGTAADVAALLDRLATSATTATSATPALPLDTDGAVPASRGHDATAAAWWARARHAAALATGHGRVARDAHAVLRSLAGGQQPDGRLLKTTAADNPEIAWFHELVLLHALAGHALETGDQTLLTAARAAARYHAAEIQPDHATTQPWAINAFMLEPSAAMLADYMLHAADMAGGGSLDGVALLLLSDTVHAWRRYEGVASD